MITTLLACLELELSGKRWTQQRHYDSFDLFVALLGEWGDSKNETIMDFLNSELVMISYLKRLFGYLKERQKQGSDMGKVLKTLLSDMSISPIKPVVDRPLFKPSLDSATPSLNFNIHCNGSITPIEIKCRTDTSDESQFDINYDLNFVSFLKKFSDDLERQDGFKALKQEVDAFILLYNTKY